MRNPYRDFSNVNPQRENGHRQIENSVFQALIRADLPGIEYSLVLCVIDKTWGYNKTEDVIPLSQFAEATQQRFRGNIAKALQSLEKKHLLVIQKSGPGRGKGNTYMFNKHWDTWLLPRRKGVEGTPLQEIVSPIQHLALNSVVATPLPETPAVPQEMLSAPQQSGSKGIEGTPLANGVEGTPIKVGNGVKSEGNGVTHAQGNGVGATPSKERIKRNLQKKDIYIKERKGTFSNVHLTADEYQKLVDRFGMGGANDRIEELSLYIKSKGAERKYKDHYATILNWERMSKGKEKSSAEEKEKGAGYGRRESDTHREDTTGRGKYGGFKPTKSGPAADDGDKT